jgi:hypothetical protein
MKEIKGEKSKINNVLSQKIGEVVEASSAEFMAQCYKLGEAPPLGCLVKTQDNSGAIYGLVYNVVTHGLEPGRRVIARGENLKSEAEIFATNPQLARLLATDFKVLVLGHIEGKNCHHYLPPKSASIHSFVYICQLEEVKTFTQSMDFLSLIVNARIDIPVDEVVAAFLRYASKAHVDGDAFLVKAGKELARMLSADTNRLNSLLKRIK